MALDATWFPYVKFAHILFAIVAVGANATYAVWLARAARDPTSLPFALRGVKFLDDRIANPAYGLLLLTGLLMMFAFNVWTWAFWNEAAIAIYVVVGIVGGAVYGPTLKAQIATLERAGPSSAEYARLAKRGQAVGIVLAVLVVAIVFLMVTKPTL